MTGSTETDGDRSLQTNIYIGAVGSGYALRIDRYLEYKGKGLGPAGQDVLYVPVGTLPSSISWSEQSSNTETDGDDSYTDKSYLGTPLDGGGAPIGSTQFLRLERTHRYDGAPSGGPTVALEYIP